MNDLQNGSDIRGISITTTEHEANLTPDEVRKIGYGLVQWLEKDKGLSRKQLRIALGKDSRLSGDGLKTALQEVLSELGVTVIDVGLATTPAMFMATQFNKFACDASVMFTASHLPYFYNGLKIFTVEGGAEHEDIEKILTYANTPMEAANTPGDILQKDLITPYAKDLVTKIRAGIGNVSEQPLSGLKIIVDAGNGAGGFFTTHVLEPLGADTTGSQFLEPDGTFPNHIPNPDNKEAIASIQKAVKESDADLGIIFDTDVDRAAVITSDGLPLNRNNLIAVLAYFVLQDEPGATIVTNSPTSSHLKAYIESLGGKQYRYISGYRNVINKGIELNKAGINTPLAIETSGHAAFRENYFLDDGAYVIAKLLIALPQLMKEKRTLSDLIATLKQPAETHEVRFNIQADDVRQTGMAIIEDMAEFVEKTDGFSLDPENEEGIRVNVGGKLGSGWFLLRLSLHEPLLVLQVENDVEGKVAKTLQCLTPFFKSYHTLDTSRL